MKQSKLPESVWLGFDVKVESGAALKPYQIHFWKEDEFKHQAPEAPFHYMSDALVGLSLVHLNQHLKSPFNGPKMNYSFCYEAWLALEPHHELFQRSQPRVNALRENLKPENKDVLAYFERNFSDVLDSAIHPWGVDLNHLHHLIEAIDYLETKIERPLLYNFSLKFSKPLVDKLHYLHSLLFNLRALIALDYNAHIQDASHEAVKVDSITDYLSKAEYVSNDALLYLNFLKQKDKMPAATFENMKKSFKSLSHNSYCLVESLPKSFLNSLRQEELEESLYIVQMDWLLGTDAGLLFKVREELYGLSEGYDKVFWPDAQNKEPHNPGKLSVSCKLELSDIYPSSTAA